MEWNYWKGKKIFVELRGGGFYNGVVQEVLDEGNGLIFISIIDKFGRWVTFSIKEILKIVEEENESKL